MCQGLPATPAVERKARDRSYPGTVRGSLASLPPRTWTSGLQNHEGGSFCDFTPPSSWYFIREAVGKEYRPPLLVPLLTSSASFQSPDTPLSLLPAPLPAACGTQSLRPGLCLFPCRHLCSRAHRLDKLSSCRKHCCLGTNFSKSRTFQGCLPSQGCSWKSGPGVWTAGSGLRMLGAHCRTRQLTAARPWLLALLHEPGDGGREQREGTYRVVVSGRDETGDGSADRCLLCQLDQARLLSRAQCPHVCMRELCPSGTEGPQCLLSGRTDTDRVALLPLYPPSFTATTY